MATSLIFHQSIPFNSSSKKTSLTSQITSNKIPSTVSEEVTKSKYSTVSSYKMNKFPYFLIGKIVSQCSHSLSSTKNFINGVGILIGPSIVLTVAHNLCHINKNEVIFSKSVCFYPAANGDFVPFTTFKSKEYYIPQEYINATLKGDKEEQLSNDWGVVFFDEDIGDEVLTLFDISNKNNDNIMTDGILYSFFTNEDNKVTLKNNSNIALVGYSEQRSIYRNSNAFHLNSFSKNEAYSTNVYDNNLTNMTSHASSLGTQGKITSEILNEGRDLFRTSITSANNINLSIESFPLSSPHYQKENSVDFLILYDPDGMFLDYDGEYTEYDKVVMSESIGELSRSDMVDDNISYKISTYKGQSGSPVFIFSPETNEYTFIGLHSRRGPCKYGDNKDISLLSFYSSICDFNKGIGIYGVRKKIIIGIITKEFSKRKIQLTEDISVKYQPYIFKMISLSYGGEVKFMGLFRVDVLLSLIFGFAGKLLLIPDEFILLSYNNEDNEEDILNYNYDKEKSLIDIFGDYFYNKITFEVGINIKKYGEHLAKKILNNFLLKNKITDEELVVNFKEYTKEIFSSVFEEISFLDKNIVNYGLLFKKIRKNILLQLKIKSP